MRSSRTIALITALLLAPGCGQKPSAPPDDPSPLAKALQGIIATCALARGRTEVRRAGESGWEPMEIGAVFHGGDEVRTGPSGFTRIELVSGGRLELEEKASLRIGAVAAASEAGTGSAPPGENRVQVGAGVVRGLLQARSPSEARALVIESDEGAPVRLTPEPGKEPVAFRLTRDEKKTELALTRGEAQVTDEGGHAQALRAGQAVDVAAGTVSGPSELIGFPPSLEPGIDARFHFAPSLSIRLAWKAVPGASGYRVQVAGDLSFQVTQAVADLNRTDYTFSPGAAGLYAWRVAAHDAQGRYGEYGFARRIFCEKEQPKDLLIGPEDNLVVRYADALPRITFSWESAASARSYRLVVAKGPSLFQEKVVSQVSTEQRLDLETLAAGDYYWGVYVESENPQPIFVRPRRLIVEKVAAARLKLPKTISEWGEVKKPR